MNLTKEQIVKILFTRMEKNIPPSSEYEKKWREEMEKENQKLLNKYF